MFECKFKYELEDSIVCAKYIYKSQKRKQDKVIAILIPILIVCMIGMMIYDIVSKKSIVWDIVLLVALVILIDYPLAILLQFLCNKIKLPFTNKK